MKRIIIVNSNCCHGSFLEKAIAGIRRTEFRCIELTAMKGWTEHVFPSMPPSRLCRVQGELQKVGLTPISMSDHCNLTDPQRLPGSMSNIRLAVFSGCKYIVSSVGGAHLKGNTVAPNQEPVRSTRNLLPLFEKHAMKLVLEVHGEYGSGEVMKEVMDAVASPLVSISYGTTNAIFYDGVDLAQDLNDCMSNIGYMRVKDRAGERTEWNFPMPGEGAVDLPMISKKLDRTSNSCPLSMEIEFTQDGPKDLTTVDEATQISTAYPATHGFPL